MGTSRMNVAKEALELFVRSLPHGCRFDIISFGSRFDNLGFDGQSNCLAYNEESSRYVIERI